MLQNNMRKRMCFPEPIETAAHGGATLKQGLARINPSLIFAPEVAFISITHSEVDVGGSSSIKAGNRAFSG
jgi:hypothetical protein